MGLRSACPTVITIGTVALMWLFASASWGVARAQDRTVWDGVYSRDQAARGREVFEARCAGCHGDDLSGGQGFALTGQGFLDRWREDALDPLFDHLSSMPMDEDLAPAGPLTRLSDATYLDLMAHILDRNGFPAGATELQLDSLSATRLVGREGPQPLPSGATVLIVGCLNQTPGAEWVLNDASEPTRTRNLVGTTDEELRAAASLSLAGQTYQLRSLDVRGFDPEPYSGQKVQVKGELIRETGRDRVFVTAFDVVSEDCGR